MKKKAKQFRIKKFFLITMIFITGIRYDAYSQSIYSNTLYDINPQAQTIIRYNVYEYIRDCLGRDTLEKAVNENNSCLFIRIFYNPDGELNSIHTRRMENPYFTEAEWESIFDYFHDLPPLPLPNCYTYINLYPYGIYTKDTITDMAHQSIIDFSKMFHAVALCPKVKSDSSGQYTDSITPFDAIERKQYKYKPFYRTEHPDSLFGLMRWEEVKRRYHDALESGEFKEKPRIRDLIYDGDYDSEGYKWEKIPVRNFSVNMRVPSGSKISVATDTLSASISFPDLTSVDIKYTKDEPWTKLYDGETNPRKRHIYNSTVTDNYLLSSGEFICDGKTMYWQRIRYRYGLTVTLYTSKKSNLEKYYSPVIATITAVLRPKFKTIYLKDDGY